MPTPTPLASDTFGPPTPPAGTPLVLIHGFPLDRRIFADLAPLIAAKNHRVVTIDLPGFGDSHYDAGFSLDDLARLLRGFLQSRGLLPCVLGGLSMGGYVALAYHRLFRADLKGLLLLDTKASADTPEARETRLRMAEVARREGSAAVAKLMQPKMLSPLTREKSPAVEARLMEIMTACPPATIATACLAMRDRPDFTPDLATVAVPLLMITGTDDAITPPDLGRALAAAAPQGTFAEIPAAGHLSTMEQPQAVANALLPWLAAI